MRAPPLIARVRHYGVRAYQHALHFSAGLNHAVETGAHLYGEVLQPLLRSQGVDTSRADTALMSGYQAFDQVRGVAQRINAIV